MTRAAIALGFVIVLVASPSTAQVVNPNVIEFLPPSEHDSLTRYDLVFYQQGSTTPVMTVNLGKPARQSDGLIRADLASLMTGYPLPNVTSEIRVVAVAAGGIGVSAPSNSFVYTVAPSGATNVIQLGDMAWSSMTNGWGPAERNRSNGETGAADGRALTLNGRVYAKGLGVHAGSTIRYALSGTCSTFQADVGVDDETGANGSVVFQVWADGSKLFDSGVMNGNTATRSVSASIQGRTELTLIVTDGGDGFYYDHGDWADARLTCGSASSTETETFLSDAAWSAMTNGWGPAERNRSNGEVGAADGRILTLNGRQYTKGLGVHAGSTVRYALNRLCSTFQADVGLDDEIGSNGSVVFEVWADGVKLFDSGVMRGSTATRPVSVSIAGRNELTLVVGDGGDGFYFDHADWADARVSCSSSLTPVTP